MFSNIYLVDDCSELYVYDVCLEFIVTLERLSNLRQLFLLNFIFVHIQLYDHGRVIDVE